MAETVNQMGFQSGITEEDDQAKTRASTYYNRHNGRQRFRVMQKIGIYTVNPAKNAFKVLAFRQFLHLKTVKRRK